jgi:asparagine synthase (glutamine-hydrolysing)
MSTGLEGREPLLDHRLFEFAARLPIEQKIDRNQGKLLLREIAHRYLPRHLMERPKTGFSVPVINWLRGELRDLLEEFCSPAALMRTGLLNVQFVRRKLDEFYKGQLYYTPLIWRVFVFQQWSSRWLP